MTDQNLYRLSIGGMSCAGCVASVEDALRRVPGVVEASVSFADHTAQVKAEVTADILIKAVVDAGYEAAELKSLEDAQGEREVPLEGFEIDARFYVGSEAVPLTFTESDGRYTTEPPGPLAAGDYVVELRIRPMLEEGAGHWIEYPDLGFTVEASESEATVGAVENHEEPPPEEHGETGWGGALLLLLLFNLLLGGGAFGALFVRKRLQLRRALAEAEEA